MAIDSDLARHAQIQEVLMLRKDLGDADEATGKLHALFSTIPAH